MNKEEQLKRLIQSIGPDQPGSDFTIRVTKGIQELAADTDPLLHLLHNLPTEKVTLRFTEKTMDNLLQKKIQPIISKKIWWAIAACLTGVIFFAIIHDRTNHYSLKKTSHISETYVTLFNNIQSGYFILLPILFAIFMFLVIDFLIGRSRNRLFHPSHRQAGG
ncbi:hypothetical protein [Chitinophaga sp. LS1]|uniref:hypothetical protein n=1 Tax=Chitinophaga sp. LS1 TaxID=3051176 RepID=UPI002AAAA964|nr:hypothetical protein [Chitinophaga sp. LS1]WPV64586.1 hypothetical protein QQL36_22550 [Chitinophaga sp. LS1]